MASSDLKTELLNIEVNVEELNAQQIRLIKSINCMLTHVLTTDEEDEFFDSSSELLRMVASAVKRGNFPTQHAKDSDIPYGDQALEFCVDTLSDQVYSDEVLKFDN